MVILHNFKSANNKFTDSIERNQPNSKEFGQKHRENGLLDQNILSFYSSYFHLISSWNLLRQLQQELLGFVRKHINKDQ